MDRSAAEDIAIQALGFIAGDERLLSRFLAISGIDANHLRAAAAEPGFLAGVLHFVTAYEPTLLEFATSADLPPQEIMRALRQLPSGDDRYEAST